MSRICTKCSLDLPLSAYPRDRSKKGGLRVSCKACHNKVNQKWRQDNPEKSREAGRKWYKANPESTKERARKWRLANPGRAKEISREASRRAYAKDPEKARERGRRRANPEKERERKQKYAKANPGKVRARQAMRRAAVKQATPNWLSESQLSEISRIYATCPKGWHVDHIVPLQGATVSGLHLPCNLQHLAAKENRRKGNKLIEVQ